MSATLAAYNAALKQVWTQDTLERQYMDQHELLDKIAPTSRFTQSGDAQVGLKATVPIEVSRNGGYSAFPSSGSASLNAAGNVGIAAADYDVTYHAQQIKVETAAIVKTEGKPQSVANTVDTEVKGATEAIRNQLARQLHMNGDALIANCGTTTTSTTVQLQTTGQAKWAVDRGFLDVGMTVDIGTTGSEATIVGDTVITAVDPSAYTITIGSSVSTTSSHYVSVANARSGTTAYEMNGLKNLISTATLGGVTTTAQPKWQPGYTDSTSTSITLPNLVDLRRRVRQSAGGMPTWIYTSYLQEENLYLQLQQQARYASDDTLNAGNQDKVKFAGMPLMASWDCPDSDLYLLTPEDFLRVTDPSTNGKPQWATDIAGVGGPLVHVQGTTGFQGTLFFFGNLGLKRRNRSGRMTGLTS